MKLHFFAFDEELGCECELNFCIVLSWKRYKFYQWKKCFCLVSSMGQIVIAGNCISLIDFCMTDVTTGWSCQALKLWLMMKVAEQMPRRTIMTQINLEEMQTNSFNFSPDFSHFHVWRETKQRQTLVQHFINFRAKTMSNWPDPPNKVKPLILHKRDSDVCSTSKTKHKLYKGHWGVLAVEAWNSVRFKVSKEVLSTFI